MNGLIDHLRMDINAKSAVAFPIATTNAIYISALDIFISCYRRVSSYITMASDNGYRVLQRIRDGIKILFRGEAT